MGTFFSRKQHQLVAQRLRQLKPEGRENVRLSYGRYVQWLRIVHGMCDAFAADLYFDKEDFLQMCGVAEVTKGKRREKCVPKLSNGMEATLGNYLHLCEGFFGADSKATEFIRVRMEKEGPEEVVTTPEPEMVWGLVYLHTKGRHLM